ADLARQVPLDGAAIRQWAAVLTAVEVAEGSWRVVGACIDTACNCSDRAGVIYYRGPSRDEAAAAVGRVPTGYRATLERLTDDAWVVVEGEQDDSDGAARVAEGEDE